MLAAFCGAPAALAAPPEESPEAATGVSTGPAQDAQAGDMADPEAALGPEPRDPNDAPMMKGPPGSFPHWSADQPTGRDRAWGSKKRVQFTVAPSYAVFRWPFVGRGNSRIRGGGAQAEIDIQILRWLWAKLIGGVSWHPVEDLAIVEDDALIPIARSGWIRATQLGVGFAYPLDLGRWQPLIDGGAGLFWIQTPIAVQDGQRGGSCRSEGLACEPGLRCGDAGVCESTVVPTVHAGIGVDYLLGEHWALGMHVRYHALLSNPADFPVYYTGTFRLSLRF